MSQPTPGEIVIFCSMLEDYRNWSAQRIAIAQADVAAGTAGPATSADMAAMDRVARMIAATIEEMVRANTPPTMVLAVMAQMLGILSGRWGVAQTADGLPLHITNVVVQTVQMGVTEQKSREEVSMKKH